MERKKIIFPGIIVFDYNIRQTFCDTNWQKKNGPKIGRVFLETMLKTRMTLWLALNPCRNIRISVGKSFVREVSLYQ